MKKLILLITVLAFWGCDNPTASTDCAGVVNGTATIDDCGVCDGGNADKDCAGVCGGTATSVECTECEDAGNIFDCSGYCGIEGDGTFIVEDCAGECGGSAVLSGCDNLCNSTAVEDACGECGGSGSASACHDLLGSWDLYSYTINLTFNGEPYCPENYPDCSNGQWDVPVDADNALTFTFESNNTCTVSGIADGQSVSASGTFITCSCNQLSMDFASEAPFLTLTGEISFSGNAMIFTYIDDGGEGYAGLVSTVVITFIR